MLRLLGIGFLVVLQGCAGIRHSSDFDPAIGFREYESYEWALDARGLAVPTSHEAIRDLIDEAFSARGYREVTANADFLVHPHLGPGGIDFRATYQTLEYTPSPNLPLNLDGRDYPADALVLDVIDRGSGRLVWRGVATRVFDPETGRAVRLQLGVEVLMRDFPPP